MTESKKTPARPTLKAVRGTRDLLPDQTPLWNHVESTARNLFARYGFGEIRTPIFETTELFARGVGEETDIVSKEMFTWEDGERFDNSAALKDQWIAANIATAATPKLTTHHETLYIDRATDRRHKDRRLYWKGILLISVDVSILIAMSNTFARASRTCESAL